MAKAGQMGAVKIMAKDLVRTRKAVKKFMLMKANSGVERFLVNGRRGPGG